MLYFITNILMYSHLQSPNSNH